MGRGGGGGLTRDEKLDNAWGYWGMIWACVTLGAAIAMYAIGFRSLQNFGSNPDFGANRNQVTSFIPLNNAPVALIVIGTLMILRVFIRFVMIMKESKSINNIYFNAVLVVLETAWSGALFYVGVECVLYFTSAQLLALETDTRQLWNSSVESNPGALCSIQEDFNCAGFQTGSCIGPELQSCPDCSSPPDTSLPGCFPQIVNVYEAVYREVGIVSLFGASVLFLDALALVIYHTNLFRPNKKNSSDVEEG